MKALLLLTWLGTAPPGTVVVGPNESLRQVAERTLGDARATEELRALNGLASDDVAPGTRLKVPGHERVLAQKALETARTLVASSKGTGVPPEAAARLKDAETHFRGARYTQAAEAANAVGKLVAAERAPRSSAFSVAVGDGDSTTVTVKHGPPVRVEAEGVTQPVAKGESLRVEKGQPPPAPLPPLVAPSPAQPEDAARLKRRPDRDGHLGPVKLTWAAVRGAERYEVEVSRAQEQRAVFTQTVTTLEAKLPVLPEGRYRWTVRAVGPAGPSDASAPRHFELVPERLKLEVKKGQWQ
ncbi:LysM peptidoglycan-binding domain-containing protein [Corallococcus macrosporus]|uniref:Peptidoglycan-binding protein LysM n=1 Tax=Corallococcus macrosporus DSM 14697 TaxID=1189310 RepID=A0A250JSQ0_9BACT|nr:LysM peptidoglycan-binding domain-containing protein [Corallococcus macrosporus]ATB46512.1 peptidoglycan-binding protein LysM [Corallococcus macrosporus DSM 14697]